MDVRRASACRAPWLVAAVVVYSAGAWVESNSVRGGALEDEDGWYAPIQSDFRPEYDRDRVNRRVQTWIEYWGWIKSFYDGNVLSSGWSKQARATVGSVKSKTRQKELIDLFNNLGKRISMEWAKDYGVRKISTTDLSRWSAVILRAQRAENGTGDRLKAALVELHAEVTRRTERSRNDRLSDTMAP